MVASFSFGLAGNGVIVFKFKKSRKETVGCTWYHQSKIRRNLADHNRETIVLELIKSEPDDWHPKRREERRLHIQSPEGGLE